MYGLGLRIVKGSSSDLLLIINKSKRAKNDVNREEPPYETKGRVTPVRGKPRRLPPIIRML